jgi:hypothetical protein
MVDNGDDDRQFYHGIYNKGYHNLDHASDHTINDRYHIREDHHYTVQELNHDDQEGNYQLVYDYTLQELNHQLVNNLEQAY